MAKLDESSAEALIRAFPVFKARGKSYAFQSVYRDFAYIPPVNVVKVLALESSELGPNGNPRAADSVAKALRQTGFQVLPFDANQDEAAIRGAYAGDAKALAGLGVDATSPYAAFVIVEVQSARQMELNGKKYNIFTAAANVNLRLVRSDGTIAYSLPIAVKGQGGNVEAAVADAFKRADDGIGSELMKRTRDLQDAMAK